MTSIGPALCLALMPFLTLSEPKVVSVKRVAINEGVFCLVGPIGDDLFAAQTDQNLLFLDFNGKPIMSLGIPRNILLSSVVDNTGSVPLAKLVDMHSVKDPKAFWKVEDRFYQYFKYRLLVPWLRPSINSSFAKINDRIYTGTCSPVSFSESALRHATVIGNKHEDPMCDTIVALSDLRTKSSVPLLKLKMKPPPNDVSVIDISGGLCALPKHKTLAVMSDDRQCIYLVKISAWKVMSPKNPCRSNTKSLQ